MNKLKTLNAIKSKFTSPLEGKATELAKKDWARLGEKGKLSADGSRVSSDFSHFGNQLKDKGFDDLKNSYMNMLKKDKGFNKMASVLGSIKNIGLRSKVKPRIDAITGNKPQSLMGKTIDKLKGKNEMKERLKQIQKM